MSGHSGAIKSGTAFALTLAPWDETPRLEAARGRDQHPDLKPLTMLPRTVPDLQPGTEQLHPFRAPVGT